MFLGTPRKTLSSTTAFSSSGEPDLLLVRDAGNVGIATTEIPEGFKVAVKGKIIAEELQIDLYNNWPDFVFAKDYNLPTLTEVESHIKEKGHLPNIPSAEEVAENGFGVGEMNAKLLQKIEELTLYMIQQEKRIKSLETALKEAKQ